MIPRRHDRETRCVEASPVPVMLTQQLASLPFFFLVNNTQLLQPTLPGVTPQLFPIFSVCFLCVLGLKTEGQLFYHFWPWANSSWLLNLFYLSLKWPCISLGFISSTLRGYIPQVRCLLSTMLYPTLSQIWQCSYTLGCWKWISVYHWGNIFKM